MDPIVGQHRTENECTWDENAKVGVRCDERGQEINS